LIEREPIIIRNEESKNLVRSKQIKSQVSAKKDFLDKSLEKNNKLINLDSISLVKKSLDNASQASNQDHITNELSHQIQKTVDQYVQ
jgi:hypothetical protein